LALDPQSVEAQTRLAGSLVGLRVINVTNDLAAAGLARADELIGRALEASPHYAQAHHVKGRCVVRVEAWFATASRKLAMPRITDKLRR
jgi:hypothetical protein